MSTTIGIDATQQGSAELTFLTGEWASPPDDPNAFVWTRAILAEWGIEWTTIKRADWVQVIAGECHEYVLHGLYEDTSGCLHAFVAVQMG